MIDTTDMTNSATSAAAGTPFVLALTDPRATNAAQTGGKGASLARMAGVLPVPDGFIVTSAAHEMVLAPHADTLALALSGDDASARTARAQALTASMVLPHAVADAVRSALRTLDGPLAVRSSAIWEDLPGAAFAGQHDTVLGVRGVEAVLTAIRQCYASLWHEHALRYRDRLGLDSRQARMAVVVQRMVDVRQTDQAGVAFSADPIRGDLDAVLINAAPGLGETVVSGEFPVDEFRVVSTGSTAVSEVEATPQSTPTALVMTDDGTERVPVPDPDTACLTDEAALEVADLALAAARYAGFPQDIEWARVDGQVLLLQSRPITTFPERWTRDESAERFPAVMTPLTWDLIERGFHLSLEHSLELMGRPRFGGRWFARFGAYVYGNQNAVRIYADAMPLSLDSVDDLRGALGGILDKFGWMLELPERWWIDLDTYLLELGRLEGTDLERLDEAELWGHVRRISAVGTSYFRPNIAISLAQRTLYAGLQALARLAAGSEDEGDALFHDLLAGVVTRTAHVNAELAELGREFAQVPGLAADLREAVLAGDEARALRLLDHELRERFDRFLARHGHRELDIDAYQPTWGESPLVVLDQLAQLAESPDVDHLARAVSGRGRAIAARERLLAAVPDDLRHLADEVVRLARTYTELDDVEHYETTRMTPVLRRGLRALGDRLVDRGVLDATDDLYFATAEAMDAAAASGQWDAVTAVVAENRREYDEARDRTPAWVWGEDDRRLRSEERASRSPEDPLTGLPGSPGQVTAPAFVVHGPADMPSFPRGAILVARTTSPAWTSLFHRAAGVITESGGPLSHGAVTARELGLPAVMGVRGAFEALAHGPVVTVDGTRGTVALDDSGDEVQQRT
ncbi:PEP/pyruvate-binding domain-containing protein [Ammonicoccus fulvus]|uniref:PEP/pyruvate-binding domain-containing protein n=1 Tax=Ammonicoccus fulvus TaxID=3138240 RepID=A0ABZ3FSN1_9ACTN